jgi:hypothetical protein
VSIINRGVGSCSGPSIVGTGVVLRAHRVCGHNRNGRSIFVSQRFFSWYFLVANFYMAQPLDLLLRTSTSTQPIARPRFTVLHFSHPTYSDFFSGFGDNSSTMLFGSFQARVTYLIWCFVSKG